MKLSIAATFDVDADIEFAALGKIVLENAIVLGVHGNSDHEFTRVADDEHGLAFGHAFVEEFADLIAFGCGGHHAIARRLQLREPPLPVQQQPHVLACRASFLLGFAGLHFVALEFVLVDLASVVDYDSRVAVGSPLLLLLRVQCPGEIHVEGFAGESREYVARSNHGARLADGFDLNHAGRLRQQDRLGTPRIEYDQARLVDSAHR